MNKFYIINIMHIAKARGVLVLSMLMLKDGTSMCLCNVDMFVPLLVYFG